MTDSQARRRQLLAELAPLTSLALATGRARTSGEAAAAALDILARATEATAGLILFNSGDGYEVGAWRGLPADHVRFIARFPRSGSRLTAALDATEHPIVVDVEEGPFQPEIVELLRADGIGHVLLVGLRAAGRLTGLVGLGWPSAPSERPQDAIVLQAAALIAVSVENARLVEGLERSRESERRLVDEQLALQSLTVLGDQAGNLDELARTTIRQVQDLLGGVAGR